MMGYFVWIGDKTFKFNPCPYRRSDGFETEALEFALIPQFDGFVEGKPSGIIDERNNIFMSAIVVGSGA